ncbi:hypothetical protein BDW59DRAFT_165880 [Aspergillus cavernicola]|uniref:Carrier domain-containing protein n=1 Tax=Aspergillus cavernicola TaxID=176166 RepID=A0ABR4HQ25_9EURO
MRVTTPLSCAHSRSRQMSSSPPLPSSSAASSSSSSASSSSSDNKAIPTSGPELKAYLDRVIRGCVAAVLHLLSADEVDAKAALADLGVDSVMTVTLRQKLQQALLVKVPPTLTRSHPAVGHLVGWFVEKVGGDKSDA